MKRWGQRDEGCIEVRWEFNGGMRGMGREREKGRVKDNQSRRVRE